ncbi:MAG: DUF4340 domain-containing protein [Myxococcota bacterium]|nr:DUF4340 domain-containing protein [Myxococcota bacterium]
MSRDKLIFVGIGLLALLGFLVFKQAKRDEALGAPLASTQELPTLAMPVGVDKISITNGAKGEVVLERVPDSAGASPDGGVGTIWQVVKPVKAKAGQQAVNDLVSNLQEIKADAPINLKLDDAVRKDKQLDAEHGVRVVAWKDGEKKVDEIFGKSGPAGQLVVLADKPDQVWAAKGYSAYLYTKDAKDFRDKEILKFDDANATQVTIVNAHGTLSFTKGDSKWVATKDKAPLTRFDEEKLKDMLRAFKSLNADDFGDGKSVPETGLDKPAARLVVQLKDNAGIHSLLVGGVANGTNRWAKRPDDDTLYQIGSYTSEWVLADPSKFQQPVDAGAGDAAAAKKK